MLIFQRKAGQSFVVGDDVEITIQDIVGGKVRIAVKAPKNITILRKELLDAKRENYCASEEMESPINLLKHLKRI